VSSPASCPAPDGDELLRAVSADGSVGVRALVATELVRSAAMRHDTTPTASAALGRALMGAVLLASDAKDEETVQIQLRGDGPLGIVTVISDSAGRVRGFAGNPAADPPSKNGKLDVGGAIGRGILAVVRSHPAWREPYSGIVPIVSGEVAEDLAHYLLESEQKPSALALGVYVAAGGDVEAAGGFLVQALPGATEDVLERVETNVRMLPPLTELLCQGLRSSDVATRVLEGLGMQELERSHPAFVCRCNRARVLRAVMLLGRAELREVCASGEPLCVRCEFCGENYRLEHDELGALLPDG
jgi:molecular chaperone Hsp33